ncbi:PucR family transcriptional regulator [Arthrobacter sp. Leaf141]|uniref:PucR family transcriptional regulator ligand-binding domain-containing protein n=1 Tax=Arthrobacter sp. Leaf141 TaxID=1736273 RepID=UPI00070079C6|nr:PucR family transcriptional regulator ligand-binding domain-containing protein [Arthrobacter sp. Leaf141]KQR02198.1 PucR family transcriptional regulator [Arthrobacter sp. Leaf141]
MRHNAPENDGSPEQLDAVTLGRFLAALPAGVTVVHHAGNGAAPLRWVEPSELGDPTPYLLDGEFVLTAGLPFLAGGHAGDHPGTGGSGRSGGLRSGPAAGPDDGGTHRGGSPAPGAAAGGAAEDGGTAAQADAYVRRLVAAGVAALGFGLQPYFDAVPDALVEACRRHGLTLVEVPASIPFAALGLEFSKLLESGNAQVFRHLAETNRHLMRAVLSARPEHELLAALTERVPVWAVLVGADGRARARAAAQAGPGTNPRAAVEHSLLQPLVARLLAGSGPRIETGSVDTPDPTLLFGHPLRNTRDATLGALVLGAGKPLTPAQNNVVSAVVGLLELLVRQRTSGSLAPSQLATALLLHPDSLAGNSSRRLNALKDLLAQSVGGTRSAPVRVVLGLRSGTPAAAPAATEGAVRDLLHWRRIFDTKLVELTDDGFATVTRLKVDGPLLAEVEQLGWRLVVGAPTELPGLAAAYQRATALRPRVLATASTVREEDLTWSVAGLLGADAGALLAARLLAPVLEQEPARRDAQLLVLRSWLAANGSWDAAAKDLGLHRNSVRRQITALAELLDLDLAQAAARAELWFALQFVDSAGQ